MTHPSDNNRPDAADADTSGEPTQPAAASAAEAAADDDGAASPAEATAPETAQDAADTTGSGEEVVRLSTENERLKDQALRALAEAENTRRRIQREKEDATRYAVAGFARDLLEIADNLRRALEAAPADGLADHPLAQQLSVGVSMTEKMLADAFAKHGISRIDPTGEKFDPNYHQAMFEVPDANTPPGTVVQVIQAGYVLNGRLLRPAMVGIAKGGETPQRVDTEA